MQCAATEGKYKYIQYKYIEYIFNILESNKYLLETHELTAVGKKVWMTSLIVDDVT
jgi:hypothetical protein